MKDKDKEKFFELVQKEANFMDMGNIKPVYYAVLRTVIKSLKVNGKIRLPEWGEFRVTKHKARKSSYVNDTSKIIDLPAMNTVRFSPCKMMKEYVKNLLKN